LSCGDTAAGMLKHSAIWRLKRLIVTLCMVLAADIDLQYACDSAAHDELAMQTSTAAVMLSVKSKTDTSSMTSRFADMLPSSITYSLILNTGVIGAFRRGVIIAYTVVRWRGGATGRALDLRSTGSEFKSYSGQSCVTTLGRLFTPMCLCHQAV